MFSSAEGGSVGRRVLSSRQNVTDKMIDGDENQTKKQDKLIEFSNEHDLLWSLKLHSDILYLKIPQQLNEGSKKIFTDLLEFADDILHCKNVIIYFDKTRIDRASLVKTFMFLGFHVLSPTNPLFSSIESNSDQLSMIYTIDTDE